MMARISLDWDYKGLQACILENEYVRATVIPEVGAKVHELVCKKTDQDVLFHHPRVELSRPVFGANIDDYWSGGIDECIPTGAPCAVGGDQLPILGEAWSMPWSVERVSETRLRFERSGVITPFHVSRTMEVRPGERVVRCSHTMTNVGYEPLDFIWGLHAGVPLAAGTSVDLPAAEVVVERSAPDDRLGAPGERHRWAESHLFDLEEHPRGTEEMHCALGLTAGWLAVRSGPGRTGFGMTFPHEVFSNVWIWMADGWRGTRCLAIEPWTGHQLGLDRAIANGTARRLEAGASLSADVNLIVFPGDHEVDGFEDDGAPIKKGVVV